MSETQHLFVYGTLRSGFRNPAYQYLSRHFRLLGKARVRGKFFDKGEFPVAIATSAENFIHGELYEATSPDEFAWAIDQLDDYEGLNVEPGEIPMYKRELVEVFYNDQIINAWIYWYNRSTDRLHELAANDLLKYLEEKNKRKD